MELASVSKPNIDISSEKDVIDYDYTDSTPKEIIARVDLGVVIGGVSRPIAGGGIYVLKVYINDVGISPDSNVDVNVGVTQTILVSRQIPISTGDNIRISVKGLGSDTAINATATLRDATPIRAEELYGAGPIAVDHNYGGPDELSYQTIQGAGIVGAIILAYITSEYDNGQHEASFVVGRTTTGASGRWVTPLMLSPGNYTLIYYLTGLYGPDRKDIIVTG